MLTNTMLVLSVVSAAMMASLVAANDNLSIAYEWKEIDFAYRTQQDRADAIASGEFVAANVIPVGLEVYQHRLFLTLPRLKTGVPASLAYINLNETNTKSPLLSPYPSWGAHQITAEDTPEIVSPFRMRADRCGRLWVLDTGRSAIGNETQTIAPTSILVYDLHNDNLLRRFVFPETQRKAESFFANIAIEDADCDDTFAYAADMQHPGLVVYSWKTQESWLIKHHYFHPDPLAGSFNVAGTTYQTDGGLFGLSLSKQQPDGFAMLYFHPLSSTNEFAVSTRILRNYTLAREAASFKEFKLLGSRGVSGQSGAAFLDQLTGVLFYTLPNLDAVACWKTSNREYTIKSQGRVFMSSVQMVFPNDVKVDDQDRLWVLSDRMQQFEHAKLDRDQINFRILTGPVKEVIENTACDITPAAFPDIITRLGDILNTQTSTTRPNNAASALQGVYTVIVASLAAAFMRIYE